MWLPADKFGGRKVRAPEGSVTGNSRPAYLSMQRISVLSGPANFFSRRATETSPAFEKNAGVKRGNLYVEQGEIGDER